VRIVYITAGAAGDYCGACAGDVTLVRGLLDRGHDVLMLPLYTPLRTDMPPPGGRRIFYGGVNAWLQQHSAFFRRTPAFIDRLLDRPWLLRAVSHLAVETRPEALGPMTVSVLRGRDGRQRKELEKLLRFLEARERPHVVHLTNSLLSALAPEIKRRFDVPVVCTLQGEEGFVARLPAPDRDEAIRLLRRNAAALDALVAPSEGYADEMRVLLDVPAERVGVVYPGVEMEPYAHIAPPRRGPLCIGCLSRISPAKGTDVLVEAFIRLERTGPGAARLRLAGQARGPNRRFLEAQRRRIAAAGLTDRFEYVGAPDLAGKAAFLEACNVFCVASRYPQRRAMAALEAMASGRAVVVTDQGICPELTAQGGGVVVPAGDAGALAEALRRLRDRPERLEEMGRRARETVRRRFSAERMAEEMVALYEAVRPSRPRAAGAGAENPIR